MNVTETVARHRVAFLRIIGKDKLSGLGRPGSDSAAAIQRETAIRVLSDVHCA